MVSDGGKPLVSDLPNLEDNSLREGSPFGLGEACFPENHKQLGGTNGK